jgi:universal stress protein A
MAFAHILCPVDFSTHADSAVTLAARLAHAVGAKLTLVHAFSLPVMPMPEAPVVFAHDQLVVLEDKLRDALARVAETARAHGVVEVETRLIEGAPADAIVTAARDLAVDVIVMSTHGRTGLAHVLVGSVAEHVVRTAPCPVLTCRQAKE